MALLLENGKPLKHLDLSNNQISQQGRRSLGAHKRPHASSSAAISLAVYPGVNHLRAVLPMSHIETLNVVGNNISVRIL